jgi:hypothetical protein
MQAAGCGPGTIRSSDLIHTLIDRAPSSHDDDGGLLEPLPPPWCGIPTVSAGARIGEKSLAIDQHRPPLQAYRPMSTLPRAKQLNAQTSLPADQCL